MCVHHHNSTSEQCVRKGGLMVGSPEVNFFYLLTLTKKFDSAVRQGGRVLMLLSCFLIRTSVPSPTYSCCRRWNYYTFHFCFCACIIRTPTYSCCRRWNYYQFYYCCSEFAEFCKTIILPIANSLFSIVSQKENSKKKGRLEGGVVG